MKKIKKILSVVRRYLIKKLIYINDSLYMKNYIRYLKSIGVQIKGTPKYLDPTVHFDGTDYTKIIIGDNVTISKEVLLLTHDYSITSALVSIGNRIDRGQGELYIVENISIGDHSFIGAKSILLPGTKVGNNVIIGSGSVVKGDIPDYSIMIGNPCKRIGDTRDYAKKMLNEKKYNVKHEKKK